MLLGNFQIISYNKEKKRMEKEFVPYELALKMKQLGFDEPCFGRYDGKGKNKGKIWYEMPNLGQDSIPVGDVLSPLYQQAFRWFREKYELHSFIDCKWKNLGWEFELVDLSKMETISSIDRYNYKTFEEAELACLEKLIEIVEQKNAGMTEHGVYK
jgi:hypothetical protein